MALAVANTLQLQFWPIDRRFAILRIGAIQRHVAMLILAGVNDRCWLASGIAKRAPATCQFGVQRTPLPHTQANVRATTPKGANVRASIVSNKMYYLEQVSPELNQSAQAAEQAERAARLAAACKQKQRREQQRKQLLHGLQTHGQQGCVEVLTPLEMLLFASCVSDTTTLHTLGNSQCTTILHGVQVRITGQVVTVTCQSWSSHPVELKEYQYSCLISMNTAK